MKTEVKTSMHQSMYYIQRYSSTILKAVGASKLIPCEGEDDELARHLDLSYGIDYILVSHNGTLSRGVGCRFQEDRFARKYRTFTIRKERDSGAQTEFEKRKAAIAKGGLYPYLTMHAYVDVENDRIDRLAIAKTEEIIDYCEHCNPPVLHTGFNEVGQASFYAVDWDEYRRTGRSIFVYRNSANLSADAVRFCGDKFNCHSGI